MIRTLTLLGLGALVAGSSFAQNTIHYREGQRVEPQDVARILARPPGIKTRSIRLLDDPAAANAGSGSAAALSNAGMLMAEVDTGGAAPQRYDTGGNGAGGNGAGTSRTESAADDAPSALSLPVRFEFDSADISPSARTQLDALAEGIKMLSPGQRIVVEGHTDAVGTHEYNQILSQRRAAAVKQYLVRVHHIDSRRLVDTGVGEQQPIDGTDPLAAQNRRVQFRGS